MCRRDEFRRLLERHGQADMLALLAARTPALEEFEARVLRERGVSFEVWVRECLSREMSLRDMATGFGIYHATLWRWIKRRMPEVSFADSNQSRVTDDEVSRVVQVWRDEGVRSCCQIAERTGIEVAKVGLAKRAWQRQSQSSMKRLHKDMARRPWSETPQKKWSGANGW